MEKKDNETRIKEKLEFYMDAGIDVHVKLFDKTFLNGIILKKSKEGVYFIRERRLGDVFLFLKDIFDITELRDEE